MNTRITRTLDIDGTFLQGTIEATYAELVHAFGLPERWDDPKVSTEWDLLIDGTVATIHDWKDHAPAEQITTWSVGGHNRAALECVQAALAAWRAKAAR